MAYAAALVGMRAAPEDVAVFYPVMVTAGIAILALFALYAGLVVSLRQAVLARVEAAGPG